MWALGEKLYFSIKGLGAAIGIALFLLLLIWWIVTEVVAAIRRKK